MPSSHHRHGQDETDRLTLVRVGGVNLRQVKTVGDKKFRN